MRQIAKESAVVFVATLLLCALALLFAQGRIFPYLLIDTPFEKPVADNCFRVSLPGFIAAMAVWGYNSSGTILSDLLIVMVNATLYTVPITLLVHFIRRRSL